MVSGTLDFTPPNLHLQFLDLLRVNMQTFSSNVDSPSVSATTSEPQKSLDVITGDDLGFEIVTLNVDSPLVSATTDGPRKPSDVIVGEDLCLQLVRNSAGHYQPQLVEEKADIVQSNTSRTNFSSLIWRLPTEILSEIFLYCLPEDEYLAYAATQAPMLLTRVCRRWREVAVGLPMLWCRLQLEFWYEDWQERAFRHDDWQTRAFGYDSWLKRSRGYPLSLRLECGTDWSELQSLLQPYVQQISSLSLDFLSCDGPFMMEDFHALKELTICKYILDDPARAINGTLSTLPVNLRRINMENVWFNRKRLDSFTASPWAHLTHMEISLHGINAFTRILHLCPDLCSLTVIGIFCPIQTLESVAHTNLQSLSMSWSVFRNTSEDIGLFDVITLPNLRVLEARYTGRWPHESFMKFLTRSEYSLERLVFDSAVWTTTRERAEYATLVPSFEFIADTESNFDVDEE
ncbi:uncharacterized protein BJ212DRAFT_1300853 [Suillus subaureus]|uniref:F-box domain-containing protein n=1 Tax=Suillus subaureus TaxID=48587 RepID=A0A9P7JC85_9AGAM|nr:uncharacterized protein BJ212DRAFT_1300853 [Suillus subaureus]KAG1813984.1 hypothetical protein BJ212DRAFT_1300853 [Suillus subaureus]